MLDRDQSRAKWDIEVIFLFACNCHVVLPEH